MRGRASRITILAPLGGLLALYLAIPLVAFIIRFASSSNRGLRTPGLFPALEISAVAATISIAVIAVIGIPLAFVLARSHGWLARIVDFLVALPLALPPLMSGILLIYVVGPYTPIGNFFNGALTDSVIGIVFAQCFVASPFLIVVVRAAFRAIDPSLFDLAAGLGWREIARFRKVALPSAVEGIRAGLLLAWLRAFGEYGATVILAYHPYSLPVFTDVQFSSTGLQTTAAPTALALLLAAMVVLLANTKWRPKAHHRAAIPNPVPPAHSLGKPLSFNLDHEQGEFRLQVMHQGTSTRLAIVGPSGSGKSTTLRSIAGLLGTRPGSVCVGDQDISAIPPEHRNIGYLPQGAGLFPHLSVWRQLMFGAGADPHIAAFWLDRLDLGDLAQRLPHELSGGQRQRVALAQVLSRSPQLLLMDEPFSALDAPVRDEMRRELRRLQNEIGLSTVIVTHDPEEAALLATEIVVIANGNALQSGSSAEVFEHPSSHEVARLLNIANLQEGRVYANNKIDVSGTTIAAPTENRPVGSPIWWNIRPEHVAIEEHGDLKAEVTEALNLGTTTEIELNVSDVMTIRARGPEFCSIPAGATCNVRLPLQRITVWDRP